MNEYKELRKNVLNITVGKGILQLDNLRKWLPQDNCTRRDRYGPLNGFDPMSAATSVVMNYGTFQPRVLHATNHVASAGLVMVNSQTANLYDLEIPAATLSVVPDTQMEMGHLDKSAMVRQNLLYKEKAVALAERAGAKMALIVPNPVYVKATPISTGMYLAHAWQLDHGNFSSLNDLEKAIESGEAFKGKEFLIQGDTRAIEEISTYFAESELFKR